MLFSVLALSAVIVPGVMITNARAVQTQQVEDMFGMLGNPMAISGAVGSLLGGIGGPAILGDIFQMMFTQVQNFENQSMIDGENVFVFSANSSSTTNITNYQRIESYTTYAPFVDTNGKHYKVEVDRNYDVDITITQEALVVLIIWDHDGSLVNNVIIPMVRLVNRFIALMDEGGISGPEDIPEDLIKDAAKLATWIVMHINDIITGDEQFLFQPSYTYSYQLTGDISDTRVWKYAQNNTVVADPLTDIPGLAAAAAEDEYLAYLTSPPVSITGESIGYTGFLFHLFQFWMQKLQIKLDMAKLGEAISGGGSGSGDNPFQNVLEGVELEFSIIQHHLLGAILFNNSGSGVPSVVYEDTGATYLDSRNETQSVVVPVATDAKYIIDISDPGAGWAVELPHSNGTAVSWGVTFQNPKVQFRPVGMSQYDFATNPLNPQYDMDYMSFGFTFQPSFTNVIVPDAQGNPVKQVNFGKGVVKLDQSFGAITGLPPELSDLSLAVIYFSHVLHFRLDFSNVDTPFGQDVDHYYRSATGTLDFLNADDQSYFGAVDIAGPNYEMDGTTYPARTSIVPFALFNFVFQGDQTVANDNFSISTGEAEFRQQTLFVELTSAWAFYVVAYPNWHGTELIHDPTFSIFMQIDANIPWGVILLIAAIGAIVAASVVLYMKRMGRF